MSSKRTCHPEQLCESKDLSGDETVQHNFPSVGAGVPDRPAVEGSLLGIVRRIRKALPGKSRRPSPTMQIKRWQIPSYSGYSQQFKP